jgi:hypothetical protein
VVREGGREGLLAVEPLAVDVQGDLAPAAELGVGQAAAPEVVDQVEPAEIGRRVCRHREGPWDTNAKSGRGLSTPRHVGFQTRFAER